MTRSAFRATCGFLTLILTIIGACVGHAQSQVPDGKPYQIGPESCPPVYLKSTLYGVLGCSLQPAFSPSGGLSYRCLSAGLPEPCVNDLVATQYEVSGIWLEACGPDCSGKMWGILSGQRQAEAFKYSLKCVNSRWKKVATIACDVQPQLQRGACRETLCPCKDGSTKVAREAVGAEASFNLICPATRRFGQNRAHNASPANERAELESAAKACITERGPACGSLADSCGSDGQLCEVAPGLR